MVSYIGRRHTSLLTNWLGKLYKRLQRVKAKTETTIHHQHYHHWGHFSLYLPSSFFQLKVIFIIFIVGNGVY